MRVDQILPNFSYGDAIGNHTLALRDTLRRWGLESEVFALYTHPRLAAESRRPEDYRGLDDPGNVLVYHYSIGSRLTDLFSRLSCRKVLIYHNITPASFFEGVNRRAAWECRRGRQDLAPLAPRVELALGDSEFNRRELEELGFRTTGVLPIFIPFDDYRREPDPRVAALLGDGRPTVLHVGRFAPNKRVEDLLKAFWFLKRLRPDARLALVGTDVNLENYSGAVRRLAEELEVAGDILWAGHVIFDELLAWYRGSSVYLTMSEHEGFCVPLVEAMLTGLPVVAYAAAAVPGTLGEAGVLFSEKDFPLVGRLLERVIGDGDLRDRLAGAARRRLGYFGPESRESLLRGHLRELGIPVKAPFAG